MGASPSASKTRSPNYPAIGLEEAIQRLRTIYEQQQRYAGSRDVLAKLMGYKGLNGASATVVSALSKYGLLEGHGDTLRVSELGQDLALHRRGDPEYADALRTAASMPSFFQDLRDQYPAGLPHDHSLRASLIKRGFNPKSIDSAVRSYRDTMEFLSKEGGEEGLEVDAPPPVARSEQNQVDPTNATSLGQQTLPGQRAVALPLSPSPADWATLYASFPLTEDAWNQLLTVLNAMKPALVSPREQPLATSSGGVEMGGDVPEGQHGP